jgi:hypothetical protein
LITSQATIVGTLPLGHLDQGHAGLARGPLGARYPDGAGSR